MLASLLTLDAMVFVDVMSAMLQLAAVPTEAPPTADAPRPQRADPLHEPSASPGIALDPYEQARAQEREEWKGGAYFSLGLAPMSTLHVEGFHPGVRFDVETGLAWQRRDVRMYFGPDFHVFHYYGRKKPGVGLDAMVTMSMRHLFVRVGAGTAARVPTRSEIDRTRPMMGGIVGAGLVGRLHDTEGRLGLEYDIRMDTTGRVAQTVLVTMRLTFGP